MSENGPGFTFCLLADTHVNSGPDEVVEDYLKPVNRRVGWVIDDICERRPDFVIHLGDIVQPVPGSSERDRVTSTAKRIIEKLPVPIYYLPGNHDIGDKPARWIRAPRVDEDSILEFEENWGPSFQSFDHEGCHFVLLNSPAMNGPDPTDARQRRWLKRDLDRHRGRRIFVFSHYMPYLNHPGEAENYEAIDDPWRKDLLAMIREYRVEAVFSGHTHNLFVDRYHGADLYTLPSTSFYRAEFNSLFVADPVTDDPAKLGHFEVTVDAHRHTSRLVRLPGGGEPANQGPRIAMYHRSKSSLAPVGVYADVSLAESVRLPASVGAKEFSRKTIRNDHLYWALKELPAGALKVPAGDLREPGILARLEQLAEDGCRIHAFGFLPECEAALEQTAGGVKISSIEVLSSRSDLEGVLEELGSWSAAVDLPMYLAPIHSWVDSPASEWGRRFVTAGMSLQDADAVRMARAIGDEGVGLSFYVGSEEDPGDGLAGVAELARHSGANWIATVAVRSPSERKVCNRVASVLVSAFARGKPGVFIEGLTDWVWGRKKTAGILDNRHNPRRAYFVYRHLHHILTEFGPFEVERTLAESEGVEVYLLRNSPGEERALFLPRDARARVPADRHLLDLTSGRGFCSGYLSGPALETSRRV
ncbi:MAG: metallophosphoesterase [Bacillota bacterium]